MNHISHPSADELLNACARCDWPQASRHWRALPHPARQELASTALFCALAALREIEVQDRPSADLALRAISATVVDGAHNRLNHEMGRSLSADCARLGLAQCLAELDRSDLCRHAGTSLDACLAHWRTLYFPSDARSFLCRFSDPELRGGLDILRRLCSWADKSQSDSLEATRLICLKSSKRFWPDDRDDMAAKAVRLAASRLAELSPGIEPAAPIAKAARQPLC